MNKIQEILIDDGIRPDLLGFTYLTEAIEEYHPRVSITGIYKDIAEKYDTEWTRVERGMRHAITHSTGIKQRFKKLSNATYVAYIKLIIESEVM